MAKVSTVTERLNQLFDSDPRSGSSIAEFLGVSKQTISAWKNGTRSPKRSMVKKIAEYYGVSQEWLFGWDMDRPSFILPDMASRELHPAVVSIFDEAEKVRTEQQSKLQKRRQEELQLIKIFEKLSDEGRSYLLKQAKFAKNEFGGDKK